MKAMKAMKITPKPKSKVDLRVKNILKYLKDEDNCPIEGPDSGRQMLIKMVPFVLGKGAAADQRGDHQAKALHDLEEVLRTALRSWFDKVKAAEDKVATCTAEKDEAQEALDNAGNMIAEQDEEIETKKADLAEATKAEKEAQKALSKATGKRKTSSEDLEAASECAKELEAAKEHTEGLSEDLKASQAAKKTLVAAERDAQKEVAKKAKVVANSQGHLAVEQVGLEKVQSVFASFKALRDRNHKRSPRKSLVKSDVEDPGTPTGARSPGGSFLDKVASTILGFPKPEPTEDN